MNIMDMTLRQILHKINIGEVMMALSLLLNLEASARQVAVNRGYTNAVTWLDKIAKGVNFALDIFTAVKNKQAPKPPVGQTSLNTILLLISVILVINGCALSLRDTNYLVAHNIFFNAVERDGTIGDLTFNHTGNLYIGVPDDKYIGSPVNTDK